MTYFKFVSQKRLTTLPENEYYGIAGIINYIFNVTNSYYECSDTCVPQGSILGPLLCLYIYHISYTFVIILYGSYNKYCLVISRA